MAEEAIALLELASREAKAAIAHGHFVYPFADLNSDEKLKRGSTIAPLKRHLTANPPNKG